MEKVLLIGATHGDERIGLEVAAKLRKQNLKFDFLIANPRALALKKRFIDCDLNRSYPGEENSCLYEKRRAQENLLLAQKYQYVIDLHEASQGEDDFIIVPREKIAGFPVGRLDLPVVLLWPEPRGPLGDALANTVELEFGMKNRDRKKAVKKATEIVAGFIKKSCPKIDKQIYSVYGQVAAENLPPAAGQWQDFKKAGLGQEEFYPLLIDQYIKDGIFCYKMKNSDAI